MINQLKIITTEKINFEELTETIYNDIKNLNVNYIKIHINFFKDNKEIDNFFYFKVKNNINKYAFRNYFYNRYTKFMSKYVKQEVDKHIVEIIYS